MTGYIFEYEEKAKYVSRIIYAKNLDEAREKLKKVIAGGDEMIEYGIDFENAKLISTIEEEE